MDCHVDESTKDWYNMILGWVLLIELVLNLEISKHIIEAYIGPLKGSTAPMIDSGMYEFKDLNTGNIKPE